MAAHACAGAARRQAASRPNPCRAFFSSLLAFVFARRRPSSDSVPFKPDSRVHLSPHRLLSRSPRGRPVDRGQVARNGGRRGRRGRLRRATQGCCKKLFSLLINPEVTSMSLRL